MGGIKKEKVMKSLAHTHTRHSFVAAPLKTLALTMAAMPKEQRWPKCASAEPQILRCLLFNPRVSTPPLAFSATKCHFEAVALAQLAFSYPDYSLLLDLSQGRQATHFRGLKRR